MLWLILVVATQLLGCSSLDGQPAQRSQGNHSESGWQPLRDQYGRPDLNGIWQALGTAHWDLEAHTAHAGPIVKMGALGAIPAGRSVVVGGKIPYQDWAREQRDANRTEWLANDPAVKCFMPGIPRATYMPFPFQIIQGSDTHIFAYEFASASRVAYLDRPDFEHPFEAWMGHSRSHWDGDTLVVRVDAHVPDTWFDSAGNFHSEKLVVEERYRLVSDNVIHYEATITDPDVFTEPWTIEMPLYRRLESGAQLMEFKCVEFAEELMYGHLVKKVE